MTNFKKTVNPILVRMKETEKGVLYQSIVAMGQRARQINDQLKQELQIRLADVATSYDTEEANFDQINISREFDKIPKPTILAMIEMYEGKLEYEIREPEKK